MDPGPVLLVLNFQSDSPSPASSPIIQEGLRSGLTVKFNCLFFFRISTKQMKFLDTVSGTSIIIYYQSKQTFPFSILWKCWSEFYSVLESKKYSETPEIDSKHHFDASNRQKIMFNFVAVKSKLETSESNLSFMREIFSTTDAQQLAANPLWRRLVRWACIAGDSVNRYFSSILLSWNM